MSSSNKFICYHGRYSSEAAPSLKQIYESVDKYSLQSFEGGKSLDYDAKNFELLVREIYALQYSIHDLLHGAGDLVYKHMSNVGYSELRQLVPQDLYIDCVKDRKEFAQDNGFADFALDFKDYESNNVEGIFMDPACVRVFHRRQAHYCWPLGTAEDDRVELVKSTDLYTPLYYKRVSAPVSVPTVVVNDPIVVRSEDKEMFTPQSEQVKLVTQTGLFMESPDPAFHIIVPRPLEIPEVKPDNDRVAQKARSALACAVPPPQGYKWCLMLGSGHGAMSRAFEKQGMIVTNVDQRGENCFEINLLKPGALLVLRDMCAGKGRVFPPHTLMECKTDCCTLCVVPEVIDTGYSVVFSDLSHDRNYNDSHLWTARNDRLYSIAAAIALANLGKDGNFVLKITQFMSPNLMEVIDFLAPFFDRIDLVKPRASRWLNGEFYLVFSTFKPDPGYMYQLALKAMVRFAWNLPNVCTTARPLSVGASVTHMALLVQRERLLFGAQYLYYQANPPRYRVPCYKHKFVLQDHSCCHATFSFMAEWRDYARNHEKPKVATWIVEMAVRIEYLHGPRRHVPFLTFKSLPYRV